MSKECEIILPEEKECKEEESDSSSLPPVVPDWRKEKEPFKDVKNGVYSVTIDLLNEVKSLEQVDEKVVKVKAMNKFLNSYGKVKKGISPYVGFKDLQLKDLYVDPRLRIKPKVLVSIPIKVMDKVPALSEQEVETGDEDQGIDPELDKEISKSSLEESSGVDSNDKIPYVILEVSKMKEMIRFVYLKMREMSKKQISAAYENEKDLYNINLTKEAEKLVGFQNNLVKLIEKNGFNLKDLQKIKIGFTNSVQYVKVGPKIGCSEFLVRGLDDFKNAKNTSGTHTVEIIRKLPEIYDALNSRKPIGWREFINKYTPAQPPFNMMLNIQEAMEILPLREYYAKMYDGSPLNTLEGNLEFAASLNDPAILGARYRALLNEKTSVGDEIINNFPALIENYGNTSDVNVLFAEVLEKVGQRGLSLLAKCALNKAKQNLSLEEIDEIIALNFIMSLSHEQIAKFIGLLPEEIRLEINIQVALTMSNNGVQDFVPPWEQGLREGSFSSPDAPNPSQEEEILSTYEARLKSGTIAVGIKAEFLSESYEVYRQAIIANVSASLIIQIAEINFSGFDFQSFTCLGELSYDMSVEVPKLPKIEIPKVNARISIPQFPKFPTADPFRVVVEEAKKVLLKLIVTVILQIISKVITSLGDGICEEPANFGISDVPGVNFRALIKNSVGLSGVDPDVVDQYTAIFIERMGFLADTKQSTQKQVTEFIDDISVTLTEKELMALLRGTATDNTVNLVVQLAKMRNNKFSRSMQDPNTVSSLFTSLSNFIPKEFLDQSLVQDTVAPSSIGICQDEGALETFADLRCQMLKSNKGIDPSECENHLKILKDLAKNDVQDLNNIIQNLDDIIGSALPEVISSPNACGDKKESLLPSLPPALKEISNSANKAYFDTLNVNFIDDLVDHQGFLDMILADKLGAGLQQHNNLINSFFGSERGEDLNFFGLYASAGGMGSSALLRIKPPSGQDSRESGSLANFPTTVAGNLLDQMSAISKDNFEITPLEDDTVFTYNFPEADGFYFNVFDISQPGDNLKISVKEKVGGFAGEEQTIDSRLMMSPELESYLNTDLGIDFESEGRMTALNNTILKEWSSSENYSQENDESIKEFSSELFYYFYRKYVNNASKYITSDDEMFKFGYSYKEPKKIYLDPELFGGTPDNPAFYYEPPSQEGWLEIKDQMVPEIDGEEPKRQNLIDFTDFADEVNKNTELFEDDDRLYVDSKKIYIPPFYQIYDKSTKSLMESVLQATVQIYVVDTMMKGLATFSKIDTKFPQNYDDALPAYIVSQLKSGLIEEGRGIFGKKDDSYYLEFLEQIVQSYGNKADAELVEISPQEQDAIDFLNKEQASLNNSCNVSEKTSRKEKLDFLRRPDIESACFVIAQSYIKESLQKVSKDFQDKLDLKAVDIDGKFITDPKWINDPMTSSAIQDVPERVDSDTEIIKNLETIYKSGETGFSEDDFTYTPFILQRFIMIQDYDEIEAEELGIPKEITNRPNYLKGVVNLEMWNHYLENASMIVDLSGKKVSDYWKSWDLGVRISVLPPPTGASINGNPSKTTGAGATGGSDTTGDEEKWGQTFETIASTFTLEECQKSKSFRVGENRVPIFELVSYLEPMEDKEISEYSSKIISEFESKQNCLLYDFFRSPSYESIFKYSLSLSRIMSMLAIYNINGFIPSLGINEIPDPQFLGFNRGIRSWDRQTFKKTKNQARIMFESLYNSRNPSYKDRKRLSTADQYKLNKAMKSPSFGQNLKWWERKLQRPRPFDKSGSPEEYKFTPESASSISFVTPAGSSSSSSTTGPSSLDLAVLFATLSIPKIEIKDDLKKYQTLISDLQNNVVDKILSGAEDSLGNYSYEENEEWAGYGSSLNTVINRQIPTTGKVKFMTDFFSYSIAELMFAKDFGINLSVKIPDFVDENSTETLSSLATSIISPEIREAIANQISILENRIATDASNTENYNKIISYFKDKIDLLDSLEDSFTDLSSSFSDHRYLTEQFTARQQSSPTDEEFEHYDFEDWDSALKESGKKIDSILVGKFSEDFNKAVLFFDEITKVLS